MISSAQVTCEEADDFIKVTVGGKHLLTYNKATQTGPEGTEPHFERSGYIHPLNNPVGQLVSGDFSPDHKHQHALFFAWTKCQFEGRKMEFWNQRLKLGKISHEKVLSVESGEESGGFSVQLLYEGIKNPEKPEPVLREIWTVKVYNDSEDQFRFDLTSEQSCVTDSPLKIQKYHYGGMAIRGSTEWVDEGLKAQIAERAKTLKENPDADVPEPTRLYDYLTSEGYGWEKGNHSRPKWVSIHGKLGEQPTGIAVLSHPSNFRFPQPVRLHPAMPYFCWAPMVEGEFAIEPGKTYTSRYRYVIHNGAPDADQLEAEWKTFSEN